MTLGANHMENLLSHERSDSELLAYLNKIRKFSSVYSSGRPLSKEEIEILESQENRAEWSAIRVGKNFRTSGIFDTEFEGKVFLEGFSGEVQSGIGSLSLPAGLYRTRIANSYIGNCRIASSANISGYWIEDQCYLENVGYMVFEGNLGCSLGLAIHPGSESRCRTIWLLENMDMEYCEWALSLIPQQQEKAQSYLNSFLTEFQSELGYLGPFCTLKNTSAIWNSWFGPGCKVDGAQRIEKSLLLGTAHSSIEILDGALVQSSLLQKGAKVESGAIVNRCAILESAQVFEKGIAVESVIGPNSQIAKGEVIGSVVGPFVGFHHEALLISALWPRGKGNVAYGANVGSNHTGRKPDQEIWASEGTFFGLDCHVKFPCNLRQAPYSLIASGTVLLPQIFSLPFSLIAPPDFSSPGNGLNQVYPGWMWDQNPFSLFRSMYKFEDRNLSSLEIPTSLFRADIAECVLPAYEQLRGLKDKDHYGESDWAGIGKNQFDEAHRKRGLNAYEDFIYFYVLYRFVAGAGEVQDPLTNDLSRILNLDWNKKSIEDYLLLGIERVDKLYNRILSCLERDEIRGSRIFDDYLAFHPPVRKFHEEDPVLTRVKRDLDDWREKLGQIAERGTEKKRSVKY